jgi:hypothetical protein
MKNDDHKISSQKKQKMINKIKLEIKMKNN